jgi:hypothetical protein
MAEREREDRVALAWNAINPRVLFEDLNPGSQREVRRMVVESRKHEKALDAYHQLCTNATWCSLKEDWYRETLIAFHALAREGEFSIRVKSHKSGRGVAFAEDFEITPNLFGEQVRALGPFAVAATPERVRVVWDRCRTRDEREALAEAVRQAERAHAEMRTQNP